MTLASAFVAIVTISLGQNWAPCREITQAHSKLQRNPATELFSVPSSGAERPRLTPGTKVRERGSQNLHSNQAAPNHRAQTRRLILYLSKKEFCFVIMKLNWGKNKNKTHKTDHSCFYKSILKDLNKSLVVTDFIGVLTLLFFLKWSIQEQALPISPFPTFIFFNIFY